MSFPSDQRISFSVSPTRQWWALTFLFVALAGMAVVFLHHHTPGQSRWLPPCFFHELTGLFCTGCGVTRAAYALAHGQLSQAWSMNPLAVLALPIAAVIWFDRGMSSPPAWRPIVGFLKDARFWAVLVLVFTIGRNLPWFPFVTWAPG